MIKNLINQYKLVEQEMTYNEFLTMIIEEDVIFSKYRIENAFQFLEPNEDKRLCLGNVSRVLKPFLKDQSKNIEEAV